MDFPTTVGYIPSDKEVNVDPTKDSHLYPSGQVRDKRTARRELKTCSKLGADNYSDIGSKRNTHS